AAEREAPLVVANLALRRTWRGRRRVRRQRLVAVEVVRAALDVVRSRLQDEIDGGPGVPALFGFAARLHRKLIDRFNRQQRAGDAGDAALVDRRDVLARVVVVSAVDLVVVAAGAHAVDRRAGDAR